MKKEGSKFTKENYQIWSDRMKIYIKGMGAQFWQHVMTQYVAPVGPLTMDQLKEQQENIQALEAIVSTLADTKYIDVHGLETDFLILGEVRISLWW